MSAFGDHTPKQEIYETIKAVQEDGGFSLLQIIKMLSEIIVYLLEWEGDN